EIELHTEETGGAVAVELARQVAVVIADVLDRADQVHTRGEGVARTEVVDLDLTLQRVVAIFPGHAEARAEGEAVNRVGKAGGHSVTLEAAHAHVIPV